MAVINIAGVTSGSKEYTVHMVLTAEPVIDENTAVAILGEAFLQISNTTEPADIRDSIIKAAQGIMKKHQDSVDKKQDLDAMDFPPID